MSLNFLPEPTDPPQEPGLRDYLGTIQQRRALFLGVFLVVGLAGLFLTLQARPVYRTAATLLLPANTRSTGAFDAGSPIASMLAAAQPASIDAQLRMLNSPSLLAEAYRAAKVTQGPHAILPSVTAVVADDKDSPNTDTHIIQVVAQGGDPWAVARLANTVCDLYIKHTGEVTRHGLQSTLDFVRRERDRASSSLADADHRLLRFRQANGDVDPSTERQSRTWDYAALLKRVVDSESNITTAKARMVSFRSQLAKEPVELAQVTTQENPTAAKIKIKLDDLSLQRMDLLRDYTPTSRAIRDLDQQIARLQQQLAAEPREIRVLSHIPNPDRASLRSRLEEQQASLEGFLDDHNAAVQQLKLKKQFLDSLGQSEAQFGRLNQDREAAQTAYTKLDDQLRDLEIRARAWPPTARVLDLAAVPPSPVSARLPLQIALSVFLALVAAIAAVFLQEYMDDRLHAPDELGRALGLPALGYVPPMKRGQPRLMSAMPTNSSVVEAYRAFRAGIAFSSFDAPIRRLQIASPSEGEGRTTTAANLATAMARDGKSVILVDADLRSPACHKLLHCSQSPGLSEVLAGISQVDGVLQATDTENLLLLAAGATPPNPAELLGSAAFNQTIEHLEAQADVIIFDTPPCIPVSDAAIIAAQMDAAAVVVRVGHTKKATLRHALELLCRSRVRIAGLLFNQAHAHARGAYYQPHTYVVRYERDPVLRSERLHHNGNGRKHEVEELRIPVASPARTIAIDDAEEEE